ISRARSPELYAFFERVCHFTLSVDLDEVFYPEVCEITKNMLRYGPPGIVEGGCAAMTGELEQRVVAGGGELRLHHDVVAILHAAGAVTGVCVRDRRTGEELLLCAPLVISNIGPEATCRLTAASAIVAAGMSAERRVDAPVPIREARGLKMHLLSDISVIPHKGILYCLDTERIAGIVQPTNSDRRLAPPGNHLLTTHQLLHSNALNIDPQP